MKPAEDRSRDEVLGCNTSHGPKPTCPEWRLHAKTAMGSAMVITNVLLQDTLCVDLVEDDDVVEAIAA
jgi:hypothetical protein